MLQAELFDLPNARPNYTVEYERAMERGLPKLTVCSEPLAAVSDGDALRKAYSRLEEVRALLPAGEVPRRLIETRTGRHIPVTVSQLRAMRVHGSAD